MAQNRSSDPAGVDEYAGTGRATALDLFILFLSAALIGLPVLLYGTPDLANDGVEHARWAKHFATQFWQGDLYPRWLMGVNAGLGAPTFFFYPPLASYAAALFWPVSSAFDSFGWRTSGLSALLGLAMSGVTAYFWMRRLTGRRAAMFAALVYMILPYHVAIDLYNRGAIAEFWSFAWLPLILLSTDRLIQRERWSFLALTVSFALLIFSHVLITITFAAVPVAAAFFLSEPGKRVRTTVTAIAALALASGLSAVFAFPAALDQAKTYFYLALGESYTEWWLFTRAPLLNMKTRLLLITLSMMIFAVVLFVAIRKSRPDGYRYSRAVFYLGISCASFFFMTQLSAPFWKVLPFLRFLQFPTRFDTVLCVTVCGISGLAFKNLTIHSRATFAFVALSLVTWAGLNVWASSAAYRRWRAIPANTAAAYPKRIQLANEFPSFFPRTAPEAVTGDPFALEKFVAAHPPRAITLNGSASVLSWRSRRVVLRVNASEAGPLTVNQFYYPGWQGSIESLGQSITVQPDSDGLMRMEVPRGAFDLTLILGRETPERAGILVSVLSLAVAIACAAGTALRRPA